MGQISEIGATALWGDAGAWSGRRYNAHAAGAEFGELEGSFDAILEGVRRSIGRRFDQTLPNSTLPLPPACSQQNLIYAKYCEHPN